MPAPPKSYLALIDEIDRTDDGVRFRGSFYHPEGTTPTRVLMMIPGLMGEDAPTREEARQIARSGVPVFIFDPFMGQPIASRADAFRLQAALDRPETLKRIAQAEKWLAGKSPASPLKIGLAGFGLGADLALASAARNEPAMLALFYGGAAADPAIVSAVKCPVIAFFAEKDPYLTADRVDAFKAALPKSAAPPQVFKFDTTPGFPAEAKNATDKSYAETARQRTLALLNSR